MIFLLGILAGIPFGMALVVVPLHVAFLKAGFRFKREGIRFTYEYGGKPE